MLLLLYTQMHGWLSLLDGNQPTVFDNDVLIQVQNPLKTFCFTDYKYFFHLMIACEHSNDQKICLFYYSSLPNFIFKKPRFDRIFQN